MMHGHEKSDSVIVAVKPANKAVQFAAEQSAEEAAVAEPGEPRAEDISTMLESPINR
jgi:2-C-methyl-D-erythritol 4-phosphate cytidylyltransferase